MHTLRSSIIASIIFCVVVASASHAFPVLHATPLPRYDVIGFRGLPFFRFGVTSPTRVQVEARFVDVPDRFAQIVVYRADEIEQSTFKLVPGAHVCMSAGQLFGITVFQNTSDAAFVIDGAAARNATSSTLIIAQADLFLSTPGLYVLYPNVCSATSSSWGNTSVAGSFVVRSEDTSLVFLPQQVGALLPAFVAFAAIDTIVLLAFAIGVVMVGKERILKYQITLCVIVVLDFVSCTCIVFFLRVLRDHDVDLHMLLTVGIVFAAGRDAVAASLAVFMLCGVSITRLRFTASVSGAIVITSIIYFVLRVFVDRTRMQAELSRELIKVTPAFELAPERIVGCVLNALLAVLVLWAARRTLVTSHATLVNEPRKRTLLLRSAGVVAGYFALSCIWNIVMFSLFYSSRDAAEVHWREWPLLEIVPQVITMLAFGVALVGVWFPSRDSGFWIALPATSYDHTHDHDHDHDGDQTTSKK